MFTPQSYTLACHFSTLVGNESTDLHLMNNNFNYSFAHTCKTIVFSQQTFLQVPISLMKLC